MSVLEDFQRSLGVALSRGVVEYSRYLHLAIRAAFRFSQLSQWVKLAKLAVL